jgi:hypothetical protein
MYIPQCLKYILRRYYQVPQLYEPPSQQIVHHITGISNATTKIAPLSTAIFQNTMLWTASLQLKIRDGIQ